MNEHTLSDTASPPAAHRFEAEIFSAGTWNGETYTVADLREIAANFERLRGEIQPPLKFGHDGGQTLTGQRDGDPALGWVEALRVKGGKLIATFAGVPGIVMDAVRAGRYRRVSAEIWADLRRGKRRLGKVLKAVALLGADLPAVTNLQDLTAYLTSGAHRHTGRILAFTGPLRARTFPPPEQTMSETGAPARPGQPPAAELEALRAYKARHEAERQRQERRHRDDAFHSARRAALAFCERQVRAGRLAPALRDRVARELESGARWFRAEEGLRVPWSLAQALIEDAPAAPLPLAEAALAAPEPEEDGAEAGDPSARLAALATRKMAELNLSYPQAAQYVLKTHPGLARAYRDYTLNPNLGG